MNVETYLESFLQMHGEDAWQSEVTRLASQAIRKGGKHADYWKELTKSYEWLDWAALEQSVADGAIPDNPEMMMAELLRRQMPGIKSQAQYDAVTGSLDASRLVLNAILEGSASREADARRALDLAFDAVRAATAATIQLEEVPEAATSEASKAFKEPPAQYTEAEEHRLLVAELGAIEDADGLNGWYSYTKERRDKIVTQSLRNSLLDAIRAKKNSL